jgi:cell division protein FtsB
MMVVLILSLVSMVLYSDKGLFDYLNLEKEKKGLVATRDQWQEKNRVLYQEIKRLRSDLNYIEKAARKDLGLVKENELVYIFEPAE